MDKQLALLYRKSSQSLKNYKKIPAKPHQKRLRKGWEYHSLEFLCWQSEPSSVESGKSCADADDFLGDDICLGNFVLFCTQDKLLLPFPADFDSGS